MNRRFKPSPSRVLFFVIMGATMLFLLGAAVMFLWNAILPEALGAKPLSYWQALGLLVLSRLLFGSFRFGSRYQSSASSPWREKWKSMSEEDRARYREAWRERCARKGDEKNSEGLK